MAYATDDGLDALEALAAEITTRGLDAKLVTPPGRRARLHVTNPAATVLTEDIYAGDDFYWWEWSEKIAPVSDTGAAAAAVGRVLADLGDGDR